MAKQDLSKASNYQTLVSLRETYDAEVAAKGSFHPDTLAAQEAVMKELKVTYAELNIQTKLP